MAFIRSQDRHEGTSVESQETNKTDSVGQDFYCLDKLVI